MPVTIEGTRNLISRVSTGLYGLDCAMSFQKSLGFPLQTITEIYGNESIGKSTFVYYLSGVITKQINPKGKIVLCDLEGIDIEHLPRAVGMGGFDGTVRIVEAIDKKGKVRSHDDMLTETANALYDDDTICTIVDSIGAIVPTAEKETNVGEGFGAKRAVVVAQWVRKTLDAVLTASHPSVAFATNHVHTIIGGRGHLTTGGVTLNYLAANRMYLYNSSADTIKSGDYVLANVIAGKMEKLRYGGKGREFKFVIVPGFGVRPNLTALQDCVELGLAERGSVVKIKDKSFGFISKLVEQDLAGDNDKFSPFYELLEALKK